MLRLVALSLTCLTGFSGLVYEITWEKYLATLLGSHSEATAAVLALFLGGMSLGYRVFGVVTQRLGERARILLVYGLLEAGIGLYALAFPVLFRGVQALSTRIPHGVGGAGFALDVALSALLVFAPAVLMGGTIPMLTQALSRSLADATRIHAFVYGTNTAGAFAGALAAGFWLVPTLGLVGTLVAMAGVNLLAGAVFVALGLRAARRAAAPGAAGTAPGAPGPDTAGGAAPELRTFAAVALLAGFAMMTLQTVVIRLGGLAFGASQFTFSMVVAIFVLCIALGSLAVSLPARIPRGVLVANLWALFATLLALYPELQDAPYWAHRLRVRFDAGPAEFTRYYLAASAGLLLVLGLPVALSGATLPLVFHHLRREVGSLGTVAGELYSWNTLGSVLGALLGGYALFFWLDLHHVYRVAVAALAVAATLATLRVLGVRRSAAAALCAAALVAVAWLPPWSSPRLGSGLFRMRTPEPFTFAGPDAFFENQPLSTLRFYDDGPSASVAVVEYPRRDELIDRSIRVNGKSDGSTVHDYATMALAVLVPALLAERVERAFVIGYGTGVSAGEIAALPTVEEVVVAEISPSVVAAAPLFEYANLGAASNPAVRIVTGDAYRTLLRSGTRYDVISSEPSNPWVMGVEMLYSREFLAAARDRLTPGGVYAQWYHSYETDSETIALVLRTFASVFDHASVWFAQGSDLLLLGFRSPDAALDTDRIAARFASPPYAAGFRRCGIELLSTLLAHELVPLGVLHELDLPGPLHTLLHPRLAYRAARAFFAKGEGSLPPSAGLAAARVGRQNSLLQRLLAHRGHGLSRRERARMVEETCDHRPNECLALLGHWAHEEPGARRRQRIEARIVERALSVQPERRGQVGLAGHVAAVAALYDAAAAGADRGRHPLDRAVAATELFETHYHHAAPFPRETLARLWGLCEREVPDLEACRTRREAVERRLGKLE